MGWINLAEGRDRWRALENADCDAGNITHTRARARTHANQCVLLPDVFHGHNLTWRATDTAQ